MGECSDCKKRIARSGGENLLILTVIFIAYFLITLIKGNILSDLTIKVGEAEIKKAETGSDEIDESTYKLLAGGCFLLLLATLEPIYLILAIKHDIYKYPTLAALLYIIISLAFIKWGNKKDLTTEEGRNAYRKRLYQKNKRYTFKGFVTRIVFLTYFCYMFYIFVFL